MKENIFLCKFSTIKKSQQQCLKHVQMCVTNCSLQIRKQQLNSIYKHLVLCIKKKKSED